MPPPFDALFHQGVQLMQQGDAAGAANAFRATLALAPGLAAAHVNLGLLSARGGDRAAAEQHYRTALAGDPAHVHALLHLGVLLAAQKRFMEAESLYLQALLVEPASPVALSHLGVLLACLERDAEAERCYRAALAIAPDDRTAMFNLAYLLLRQGRFKEGWAAYEARASYAGLARHFQCPRWRGETLAGKTLVIGVEGGHGDMIQFSRYARVAKDLGAARVALVCHPGLKTLFARGAGIDTVYGYDEDVPAAGWDYWTPPMSFPHMLGVETIPASLPYLYADPVKADSWAPLVAVAGQRLRVGLAWQGNPRFENDGDRSLASTAVLAPLLEIDGACFFSVQKDRPDGALPPGVTDLAPHLADFDDTAACIAQLDLVISIDSAVAHLAGALGKPCWVLLPGYKTDWRWLAGRTDSPWYPGAVRLFRQTDAGDWRGVVQAMAAALQERVAA